MRAKLGKTIALVFVACAFQIQALAGGGLMGKLRTRDNKPVLVNKNKTGSGTTVMSGSQIECPDKIGATLDLGPLGRLDIAPKTDLTIVFVATEVNVQLRSGYLVLTTNKGIKGSVTTSEGAVFATDSSKLSSVVAKTTGAGGPETGAVVGAAAGGIGTGTAAGVAGAAAAVVGGASAAKSGNRGSNLSTDNPRQP
jgi:hypothetical protein